MKAEEDKDGGESPLRIKFIPEGCLDIQEQMVQVSQSDHVPHVEFQGIHDKPLAIVAGGPSVKDHLDELKDWKGDIWGINNAAFWLKSNGIEATFFTVDPIARVGENFAEPDLKSIKSALIASSCRKELFDALEGRVKKFHMYETSADGMPGGSTSATRTMLIAIMMGYKEVHFFGCDSSFEETHYVFGNSKFDQAFEKQLIVKAGEETFRTIPPYYLQAQNLAETILNFPQIYKNRSGGLVKAMIENPDWEVVAVSEALKESMEEQSGETSIFNTPYTELENDDISQAS
jgi:hypothetical protein